MRSLWAVIAILASGLTKASFELISGRVLQQTCAPMPQNMSLCQGVGYDKMWIPNLLGHDSVAEAASQLTPWGAMVGVECSPSSQRFLCSLYAPVCGMQITKPIPPCRSLCEEVRDGCLGLLTKFGFTWPPFFNCSNFPRAPELCVESFTPSQTEEVDQGPVQCSSCNAPDTFEGIIHSYCQANFLVRMKIRKTKSTAGSTYLMTKKSSDKKKLKLKFYGSSGKGKDRRALSGGMLKLAGEPSCECASHRVHNGEYHMVAGTRDEDGSNVKITFVTPWKDSNGDTKVAIKKALRFLRKTKSKSVCKGGQELLTMHKTSEEEIELKEEKRRKRTQKSAAVQRN